MLKSTLENKLSFGAMTTDTLVDVLLIEHRAYSKGWTEQMFKDCLKSNYLCKVLLSEGKIIGYFIVQIVLDEYHILNLCVDPDSQRNGLGLYQLSHIKDCANEQEINRILLEVRVSNGGAKKLYSKFGFQRNGLRKKYYPVDLKISAEREDAQLMALELGY